MKKALLLVTLLLVTSSMGWAGACSSGSLADYIGLGSTGCTIGDKTFNDFAYSKAGIFPIRSAEIGVTPCPSMFCGNIGVPLSEEGFVLNAAWQVLAGQTLDSTITYSVTSTASIVDAFLLGVGMGVATAGLVTVAETLSNGALLPTIGARGLPTSSGSVTFPGVKSLTATEGIGLTGGDGVARISVVANAFSQGVSEPTNAVSQSQVPEPASKLLFSSGLLALGWYVRRRKRN
jgi:hypothetical protein